VEDSGGSYQLKVKAERIKLKGDSIKKPGAYNSRALMFFIGRYRVDKILAAVTHSHNEHKPAMAYRKTKII